MGGMNDETELTLAVRLAGPEQCDVGDELARLAENGRAAEPLALAPDRRPAPTFLASSSRVSPSDRGSL